MKKRYFTQSHYYQAVQCAPSPYAFLFVRDMPRSSKTQEEFACYLDEVVRVFGGKVGEFINLETSTSAAEEHKLRLMLETIINAKRVWQEESVPELQTQKIK